MCNRTVKHYIWIWSAHYFYSNFPFNVAMNIRSKLTKKNNPNILQKGKFENMGSMLKSMLKDFPKSYMESKNRNEVFLETPSRMVCWIEFNSKNIWQFKNYSDSNFKIISCSYYWRSFWGYFLYYNPAYFFNARE